MSEQLAQELCLELMRHSQHSQTLLELQISEAKSIMSPVGHSLVGATISVTLWRSDQTTFQRSKILLAMVVAANVPDLPFPYWGHSRYDISHSVFSGMLVVVAYSLLARLTSLRQTFARNWHFIVAGAVAVYSHYFLDTLYNHGKGLAAFWPLSDARVALPVPWLAHMQLDPLWGAHNFKVWAIELLVFGLLSVLFLFVTLPLRRTKRTMPEEHIVYEEPRFR